MTYNYTYCICALFILLISYWFLLTRKDMRRRNSKLFLSVLVVETIYIVADLAGSVMDSVPGVYSLTVRSLMDGIFLTFHVLMAPLMAWYWINFNGLGHKMNRPMRVIFAIPAIALIIIPMLVPRVREQIYYFDENQVYHMGPAAQYTIVLGAVIYEIIIIGVAILNRNRLSREQKGAVAFLVIFCTLPTIIEKVFLPSQILTPFFESVGIFMVLLTIDNQNWVYDMQTGTYNRLTTQRHLKNDIDN